MEVTRRRFIGHCLMAGGVLTVYPPALVRAREGGRRTEDWKPAYAKLEEEGRFAERVEEAYELFRECKLCPRGCGVNRLRNQRGFCRAPAGPVVHSASPHFGEELPLVGRHGSGTIFFSNCNLRCVFCQNWPIAHEGRGQIITEEDLAGVMLELQRLGCHNINVVTPTHVMPTIIRATRNALHRGLRIPLVYNTGGYEDPEIVRLLDGVVDIYLPDMKYTDGRHAAKYSAGAEDYPEQAKASVLEMHRQVGGLVTDDDGIALRGVMIRHLVMPNRVAGTREFVEWVATELPIDTYVNIMAQYRVEYEAFNHPKIARAITPAEFVEAMDWAKEAGLSRLDARSESQWQIYRKRRSE